MTILAEFWNEWATPGIILNAARKVVITPIGLNRNYMQTEKFVQAEETMQDDKTIEEDVPSRSLITNLPLLCDVVLHSGTNKNFPFAMS